MKNAVRLIFHFSIFIFHFSMILLTEK